MVCPAFNTAPTAEFDHVRTICNRLTCLVLNLKMLIVRLLRRSRILYRSCFRRLPAPPGNICAGGIPGNVLEPHVLVGHQAWVRIALADTNIVLKGDLYPIPTFVEASANAKNVAGAVAGGAVDRIVFECYAGTINRTMAAGADYLAARGCRGTFSNRVSLHAFPSCWDGLAP